MCSILLGVAVLAMIITWVLLAVVLIALFDNRGGDEW